jgi:hypothetical protein
MVIDNGVGEKFLVAFVVWYQQNKGNEFALIQDMLQKLPKHEVPRKIISMDQMPVTPQGKIDEKLLAAKLRPSKRESMQQANSGKLKEVEDLMKKTLGLHFNSETTNFWKRGGTSIAAIALAESLNERFGTKITANHIISNGSLEGIVSMVSSIDRGGLAPPDLSSAMGTAGPEIFPLDFAILCVSFVSFVLECPAPADQMKIQVAAWIQRHECLRTKVHWKNGEAYLEFLDEMSFTMESVQVRHRQQAELYIQFELSNIQERNILWNLVHFSSSDSKFGFLGITLSHALYDVWSLPRLMEDLFSVRKKELIPPPAVISLREHLATISSWPKCDHPLPQWWRLEKTPGAPIRKGLMLPLLSLAGHSPGLNSMLACFCAFFSISNAATITAAVLGRRQGVLVDGFGLDGIVVQLDRAQLWEIPLEEMIERIAKAYNAGCKCKVEWKRRPVLVLGLVHEESHDEILFRDLKGETTPALYSQRKRWAEKSSGGASIRIDPDMISARLQPSLLHYSIDVICMEIRKRLQVLSSSVALPWKLDTKRLFEVCVETKMQMVEWSEISGSSLRERAPQIFLKRLKSQDGEKVAFAGDFRLKFSALFNWMRFLMSKWCGENEVALDLAPRSLAYCLVCASAVLGGVNVILTLGSQKLKKCLVLVASEARGIGKIFSARKCLCVSFLEKPTRPMNCIFIVKRPLGRLKLVLGKTEIYQGVVNWPETLFGDYFSASSLKLQPFNVCISWALWFIGNPIHQYEGLTENLAPFSKTVVDPQSGRYCFGGFGGSLSFSSQQTDLGFYDIAENDGVQRAFIAKVGEWHQGYDGKLRKMGAGQVDFL